MDMGGGGGMGDRPPIPVPPHGDMVMHLTFFWGERVQILFSGWPGNQGLGMYLLALFCVLAIAVLAECLSSISQSLSRDHTAAAGRDRPVSNAVLQIFLHAVRMGLLYLVMLAVMSFNVGVLIAAIAGHALGFLLGLWIGAWRGDGEALGNHVLPSTKR